MKGWEKANEIMTTRRRGWKKGIEVSEGETIREEGKDRRKGDEIEDNDDRKKRKENGGGELERGKGMKRKRLDITI